MGFGLFGSTRLFVTVDHEQEEVAGKKAGPPLLKLAKLRDDDIPNGGACVRAGTTLTGKVILDLPKTKEMHGKLVELDVIAEEEVYVDSARTVRQFWRHSMVVRDWRGETVKPHSLLTKGCYGLPFEIPLPVDLPCSMSCVVGTMNLTSDLGSSTASTKSDQCWVRYRLEARLMEEEEGSKRTTKKQMYEKYIGVVSSCRTKEVDTKQVVDGNAPAPGTQKQQQWVHNDTVLVGVRTDRSIYTLGNKILVSLSIRNLDTKPLRRVDVELREYASWTNLSGDDALLMPRYNRCLSTAENVVANKFLDPAVPNDKIALPPTEEDRRCEEKGMAMKLSGSPTTGQTDLIQVEIPVYANARLSGKSNLTSVWHAIELKIVQSSAGIGGGKSAVVSVPIQLTL